MFANMNPLVVFLLGIIVGWLLEWFFDLWFFRRGRLEAERRLKTVEAQRATWESRAKAAESRIVDLEQQLGQALAALSTAEALRRAEAAVVETERFAVTGAVLPATREVEAAAAAADEEAAPVVYTEEAVQEDAPVGERAGKER